MIIYDCEIVKGILKKGDLPVSGIEYCHGWRDFENMGIRVIGAYDYSTDRYRVFLEDNFEEFQNLIFSTDLVVGFNSLNFDNNLLRANGFSLDDGHSYDLLKEIWAGAGLGATFSPSTHGGFGLDACCWANFQTSKTGHGAMAPIDWQQGRRGKVIDYCLMDVRLTKQLLDKVINQGWVLDPRNGHSQLAVKAPSVVVGEFAG